MTLLLPLNFKYIIDIYTVKLLRFQLQIHLYYISSLKLSLVACLRYIDLLCGSPRILTEELIVFLLLLYPYRILHACFKQNIVFIFWLRFIIRFHSFVGFDQETIKRAARHIKDTATARLDDFLNIG
jgi:hypothetical protein